MDVMEYDYSDAEPTTYGYLNEDKTPAETLADNPDATWSGIELYRAVADAMAAIGADASNINIEFNTRNYALEGFEITAANVDGNIVISADKGNEHASATLNENNEFVFTESTTNNVAVQSAETEQSEESQDTLTANGWEAIEGATSDTYTHTIDEYDAYTTCRCVITIDDDNYIAAAKRELIANGADESKLTDDTLDNTITTEITVSIPSMEKSEDEMYNDLSVEDKLKQRLALSGIATYAAGVQLDSQTNPQWVTGLSAGMEYLTADMYAKIYGQDGKGGWLAEGKVTPQQADMYWSGISSNGFRSYFIANELDADGLPTGATRKYNSFTLTDGKLEINSEWYGKTVYFRYHNSNIVGNTATGAAVSIPASGRGTSYKDAVQVLFCYTVEEDGTTFPLTIKEYVRQATSNGYTQNGMAHVTLNTISANRASPEEMQLCVNTLMWISQRKQCEVCAADQADQEMTHFVHRVNAANAKKILMALANGGSYWCPLNDCYELMEDLDLTKLGFDSTTWKPISDITIHGQRCPYCAGQRVLYGFNDLETTFPEVAAEWDYEKNGDLTPRDVTRGTNRKVWWRCSRGHSYRATINNRTDAHTGGSGCPYCSNKISTPERYLFEMFRLAFPDAKTNTRPDFMDGKEYDGYAPSARAAYEYNGVYYHQGRDEDDNAKLENSKRNDVILIRILEHGLTPKSPYDIVLKSKQYKKALPSAARELKDLLERTFNVKIDDSSFCYDYMLWRKDHNVKALPSAAKLVQ